MTASAVSGVTIGPGADPANVWSTVREIAAAGDVTWLPAARLAVAATELVGERGDRAVVRFAVVRDNDGTWIEATIRDGGGRCARLPSGLADRCSERSSEHGGTEHVVGVLVESGADPLHEAGAHVFDPVRLLGAALTAVRRQAGQLAASEAEAAEFRAELVETNRGLLAVYAELETANQRIADLLAMLSHDIRQPLSIITGYASLLLEGWDQADDAARLRDIGRINDAGTGMTQLVEEILTLTQLDSDGLAIRSAPIELSTAVADAIAGVSGSVLDTVVVDGAGDSWVLADPRHFHQIMTNLLSNAIKYGRPPVEITVATAGATVDISVRDHGDGVPPDFVPRLFDRFARADTVAARARKGTGLGLYIVRQLVEVNAGTITFHNHPSGGGCFTLCLPAAGPPL
jgi:signal transduction histidine kinase